jgi:hypothetical protein
MSEPTSELQNALTDLHRAAKLAIVAGQQAYSLGRLPPHCGLSRFYARRARERLADLRVAEPTGVYDVECPRCGAQPTEPCWHLTHVGKPNMWPHWERERLARVAKRERCEKCDAPATVHYSGPVGRTWTHWCAEHDPLRRSREANSGRA